MKSRWTLTFTLLMMLLSPCKAFAQWSGGLKADGSWNFKKNNTENADFKLKYTGKKYYIGTDIYAGHSFLPSSQMTSIVDAKKEQDEYYKGEIKTMNPKKYNAGINLDLGYLFNAANTINASLGYGFNGANDNSILNTERYRNSDRTTLTGTQIDTTGSESHKINSKIAYSHQFKNRPDARLDLVLSGLIALNTDGLRRITSGDFYSTPKNYATFSSLNDFNTKLSVSYDDVFQFERGRMKLRTGLDYNTIQDLDGYSASTYINGHWRDSTKYKQSYFYDVHTIEPYANLTYTVGKIEISVKERVQMFWHTMLDKLDEKKTPEQLSGLFNKFDARNLLGAGIAYRINERHRFTLDYDKSISRPDYKKLCPTLMIGNSDGEYIIGNPELLPETIETIDIGYTYSKGIFVTKLDINYRDRRNTAEKVLDIEKSKDISDPGVKTIYSWINNKSQDTFGTKLDLKINGENVRADIWSGFNYDVFSTKNEVTKEDFNYELGTSIDVFLNEETKLSYNLVYLSAKQSAYNLKGEDIIANLRLTRALSKGLELYAEFKDIADKQIYEETWNADLNYIKISATTPMHRAILLGLNYSF